MNHKRATILRLKLVRLFIVLAGIVVGQVVLYGPSLIGQKVLLPLDILATESVYIPGTPQVPHDIIRSDLVENWEPARQFALSEFRAGRLPMWNPYQFAGYPVIWPKFSPFLLLQCLTASPVILAWTQLFMSLLAGGGLYLFLRQTMRVKFWAAAIPAWCYPITGFLIFWQGFPTAYPVYWLPWILLAIHRIFRRASPLAPIALSLLTGLVLVSGALDVAGQVLLVSGLYALWCFAKQYGRTCFGSSALRVLVQLVAGWVLGFLLASPFYLPVVEYAHTGARMERRAAGSEERRPEGLSALPQVVLPDMCGTVRIGSKWISHTARNQLESIGAAYTGLLATLLLAPLAWCSRRHRLVSMFWLLLALFGLSWCLNVPGLVTLLRLPGLNMMSHNRLVFATSFAVLCLAAAGLDALWRRQVSFRISFLLPVACLVALFAWCFYHTMYLPDVVAIDLPKEVAEHGSSGWVENLHDVQQVQEWFLSNYKISTALCGLGLCGWLLLGLRPGWPRWTVPVIGILMLGDLLWFAHDRSVQCSPTLHYPRIPALEQLARSGSGRVMGSGCLPAPLAETHGLSDIRGYDAVDPARLIHLVLMAADPKSDTPSYALTQWAIPIHEFTPDGIRLPPALDMLGVRYVIFRGTPPPGTEVICQSPDYWVASNHYALSRVFVPQHVETITDPVAQLEKMASPNFNPREVAYVETRVNLPAAVSGHAEIVSEIPTRVDIAVQMTTPGMVVLSDLWDKGWQAYLDGRAAPIVRINTAIRGVAVPAGKTNLRFRYEPASFRRGLILAGLASVILLLWALAIRWNQRSQRGLSAHISQPQ